MTTLATIDFTGTDGAAPAGFVVSGGGSFAIKSNKGVLKSNASAYSPTFAVYTALAARKNTELYLEYTPDATLEGYLGIALRSPSPASGYFPQGYNLYMSNGDGSHSMNWNNGGDQQNLGYGTAPQVGVPNGLKFRVFDSSIQSKIWPLSQPEPSDWDITVADNNITAAGYFVIQATSGGGGTTPMTIDNIRLSDGIVVVSKGAQSFMEFMGPERPVNVPSAVMPTGPLVSNGRTFTPILSEDFNTPAKAGEVLTKYSVMTAYDGYNDTSKLGLYQPEKVLSVHDGYLDVWMRTIDGQPSVSAVNPNGYNAMTYGRFAARYRTRTNGDGYKYVGILWPIDDDWNKGEIDWPEHDIPRMLPRPASANPGSATYDGNGNQVGMVFSPGRDYNAPTNSDDWHVAVTEWTPEGIRCYWDGQLILTISDPAKIPSTPMRPILQCETWIGMGAVPAATETHVDFDWVVVSAMTA